MGCNDDYCVVEKYPEKRNLDGCYFRVERDGKWQNICFSDLTETERGKILADKGVPWLISLVEHLAHSIRGMGDTLDIYGGTDDGE